MPAARSLTLLLAIDHRLPHGEREAVIAQAVESAYRPLLELLFRSSHLQVSLHYSGAVLSWLEANDPDALSMLQEMVGRRQVEILGGPRYDTVLHAAPSRDVQAQLALHSATLERLVGERPRGVLLPMGAWDPSVPRVLSRADAAYTFCDYRLLRAAGAQTPDGWYITEREGQTLGLLPVEPRLRTLFPWGSPQQIAYALRRRLVQGQSSLATVVPAEWFGLLPGSEAWCWHKRRWVETFIRLLRTQTSWLKTGLPTELIEQQRPIGRVYPVSGTFPEAGLIAMGRKDAAAYARTAALLERGDDPVLEEAAPWLLGPPWEACLTRHEAANRIHKYMLRISNQLGRLQRRVERGSIDRDVWRRLQESLFLGQSALSVEPDGVRRGELRHTAWGALTRADWASRVLLGGQERLEYKVTDLACDGDQAVEVISATQRVQIQPGTGGAISALQLWEVGNLVNTFARCRESWFDELETSSQLPALVKGGGSDEDGPEVVVDAGTTELTGGGPEEEASPSEPWPRPPSPPPIEGLNDAMLTDDRHPRLLFLDHFLGPQTSLANLVLAQHPQTGDFLGAPYQLVRAEREGEDVFVTLARDGVVAVGNQRRLIRIDKRYWFRGDGGATTLSYEISNRYQEPIQTCFAVELNLNIDSQLSLGRYLDVGDNRRIATHRAGQRTEVESLSLHWEDLGVQFQLSSSVPAGLFFFPVYSPVRTPTGYDRGYQGFCLILAWDLKLWGAEKKRFDLTFSTQHAT